MTLIPDLLPTDEAKQQADAVRDGASPAELLRRIVLNYTHTLPSPPPEDIDPTLALFARWAEEDADMTPEEMDQAQRESAEFTANINAERERAGARLVY